MTASDQAIRARGPHLLSLVSNSRATVSARHVLPPSSRSLRHNVRHAILLAVGVLLASPTGPTVLKISGWYVPEIIVGLAVWSVYGMPPRLIRSWPPLAIFMVVTLPLFPVIVAPERDILDAIGEWRSVVLVLVIAGLVNRAIANDQRDGSSADTAAIRVLLPIAVGSLLGSIFYFAFLRADVVANATSAGELKAAISYGVFFALAYAAWRAGALALALASVTAAGMLGALAAYRVGIVLAAAALALLLVTPRTSIRSRSVRSTSRATSLVVIVLVSASTVLLAQRLDESVLLRTQVNRKLDDLAQIATGDLEGFTESESYRMSFFRATATNAEDFILPRGYGAYSFLGEHDLDVGEKPGRPASSLDNGLYYLLFHWGLLPTLAVGGLLVLMRKPWRRDAWFALTLAGLHLLISATAIVFPVHAAGTGVLLGLGLGHRPPRDDT